ncbi:MAG TPA: xanthine dehydrogenase family protein molybdopterin-binding subunit [Stellaceae bacterium]|nr:xanthine dehydrogenase family protein molybdopterin-binding subunit [Stellaceae bacterium]
MSETAGATWVGRSIRRVEDPALVTGRGRFTADLKADLSVRFVRSAVAAGTFADVVLPETMADGAQVFTARDLIDVKPIRSILHRPDYVIVPQPVLADGAVYFVGEPIAAVVAPTEEVAEDIADQVLVDVTPVDAVVDAVAALEPGARAVHAEAPRNVLVEGRFRTDGVTAAFAGAHAVVAIDLVSRRQNALPLEARAGHAAFDTATGRVTLTCTTQMPHLTRTVIADLLGMPELDLRVVAPDVGGGFGQKMSLAPEYVVLVWLARRLRRSVAWIEDRRENLMSSFHSRDQRLHLKGAFDASGKLLALDADVIVNVGAYSAYPMTCGVEPLMAMAEIPGPYDVQEYACIARGVTTNTCPMAPYRGVSRPVITFAIERLMDTAARQLAIDPVIIRDINLIDRFPYRSATGLLIDEGSYRRTLAIAAETIDVAAFRAEQARARLDGRFLGLGFSTFSERTAYGTSAFAARGMETTPGFEAVELVMDPSGTVEARIGTSPHGQGLRTTLAQIIADELGIRPDKIRVVHGDTDRTPYGWGTFASRSLVMSGGASKLAAERIKAKLLTIASQLFEVAEIDIAIEDGTACVVGTDRTLPVEVLARAAYHGVHKFMGKAAPGLVELATYDPNGTFSNACHVAVVEVDTATGRVEIKRFLVVEDAGTLINPMIVDGQVHGGVAQGIANALFEEIVYDSSGTIITTSLADFLVPTAAEIPSIEIRHLETTTDQSLTKAKGLGEGGVIGAPAAITNAISDALAPFGIAINEIPATPQRIRALIRAAEEARS